MKAREYIEHQYIPWILFLDRHDTIKHFLEGKENYLNELYNHISKEFHAIERYELFMFRVHVEKKMLPIGMSNIIIAKTPNAIYSGDCAYLFIVYNDKELIYYTVDYVMDVTYSVKKYYNKKVSVIGNCTLEMNEIIDVIQRDLLQL
jgi:hypothetical protein